jgi:hypothetical protein
MLPVSSGDGTPRMELPVERRYRVPARWPATRVPRSETEARAACSWLRHENLVLRQLPVRDLMALFQPFFLAGYATRDLVEAIETGPDGEPQDGEPPLLRWGSSRILQWVRGRLDGWRDPSSGQPIPPPSAAEATEHARAAAEHEERQRTYEQQRAAAVPASASPAAQEALRLARRRRRR